MQIRDSSFRVSKPRLGLLYPRLLQYGSDGGQHVENPFLVLKYQTLAGGIQVCSLDLRLMIRICSAKRSLETSLVDLKLEMHSLKIWATNNSAHQALA
jgi:hypothetical protein